MRLNWRNQDGEEMPRIEVIRDVINKQITKFSMMYGKSCKKRSIDIFCVGMGFKKKEVLISIDLRNGREENIPEEMRNSIRVDLVCDLLTLAEIIPNKSRMDKIKKELNRKWNSYAENVIARATIEEDIYEKLRYYIETSLKQSSRLRLRRSLPQKLYTKLNGIKLTSRLKSLKWLRYKLESYIEYWERKIDETSRKESIRYLESVMRKSRSTFEVNRDVYSKYIQDKLQEFVDEQSKIILTLLTIGYDDRVIFSYFDETKAKLLAKEIYEHLYKEVKNSILLAWSKSKAILAVSEKDLKAKIDYGTVQQLTEKCIQKYGWSILNPLIEHVVFDMFEKSFERQAKEQVGEWIDFATKRETVRSIRQITNVLPDTFEKYIYSEDFMFGSTPVESAIHLCTSRLLDKSYKNRDKVLVIISDGDFKILSQKIDIYTDLLKDSGVIIISLYVTNKDIMTSLVRSAPKKWPDGAKLLLNAASKVESDSFIAKSIKQAGYELPDGVKLFYQINQSQTLSEILEGILS